MKNRPKKKPARRRPPSSSQNPLPENPQQESQPMQLQPESQPNNPLPILPPENQAAISGNEAPAIDPAAVRSGAEFDQAAGVAGAEPPAPGEAPPAPPPVEFLPFDIWYRSAHVVFMVGSAVTKLKSLAFDPADQAARAAFLALYETAAEIPALNFLLMPQGKWMARAGAVAAFAIPMAQGVRAEIAARRGGKKPAAVGAPAAEGEAPAKNGEGHLPPDFLAAFGGTQH